jgi:hypothetical protein
VDEGQCGVSGFCIRFYTYSDASFIKVTYSLSASICLGGKKIYAWFSSELMPIFLATWKVRTGSIEVQD